jgi:hypothetical protein
MSPRPVPWWGVLSAAGAPVLLVGGWTVAAARQPARYDPLVDTISALAAHGATDRWVMTTALQGVAVCHVLTALALRPARLGGRVVLAVGGLATLGVAAVPLPGDGSGSAGHAAAAGTAFVALSLWPALAVRRHGPGLLRPLPSMGAAAVLLGLLAWFALELASDRGRVGLAERCAAGAQALWPLAVVLAARRSRNGAGGHR